MATATKCMSKMNKKELYEHCKKLTQENQKLQLFNNAQQEDIELLTEKCDLFENRSKRLQLFNEKIMEKLKNID